MNLLPLTSRPRVGQNVEVQFRDDHGTRRPGFVGTVEAVTDDPLHKKSVVQVQARLIMWPEFVKELSYIVDAPPATVPAGAVWMVCNEKGDIDYCTTIAEALRWHGVTSRTEDSLGRFRSLRKRRQITSIKTGR